MTLDLNDVFDFMSTTLKTKRRQLQGALIRIENDDVYSIKAVIINNIEILSLCVVNRKKCVLSKTEYRKWGDIIIRSISKSDFKI